MKNSRRALAVTLIAGAALGALGYHAMLAVSDATVVANATLNDQKAIIEALQEENRQLTEDLFESPVARVPRFDDTDLPYDEKADARADVSAARETAAREGKSLMVTFGSNWCVDCRTLYKHLKSDELVEYTKNRFMFVNVDVGMFDLNTAVAAELGVTLRRGIPVAVFFDDKGEKIGATNNGELEPARYYTSRQILKFVRDIAERSRILAPDQAR